MDGRVSRWVKGWVLGATTGMLLTQSAVADEGFHAAPQDAGQQPAAAYAQPAYPQQIVRPAPSRSSKTKSRSLFGRLMRRPSRAAAQPRQAGSVQDHLRALYARDGREMPSMDLAAAAGTEAAPQASAAQPPREVTATFAPQVQSLTGVQQAYVREEVAPPHGGSAIHAASGSDEGDDLDAQLAAEEAMLTEPRAEEPADAGEVEGSPYTGLTLDQTPAPAPPSAEPARQDSPEAGEPQDPRIQRIAARTGAGLKGFCPVALRDRAELADGSAQWSSTYGGVTWRLSSAEAKATFDANPGLYVPACGGCDAVLGRERFAATPGALDHALWYRDRLYLFSGPQTMAAFTSDPARYAE